MDPIENTMIAAYLTKPLRNDVADRARREPLVFTRRPRKSVVAMPYEPEDAGLTGGTRSLYRRLLALNMDLNPRMPMTTTKTMVIEAKIA